MNLTLTLNLSVKASKDKVWQALTDPVLIRKYMFDTDARSVWKVGSPITFSGTWEGKPYMDKGTILALEKGVLLKYNYWSSFSGSADELANYSNITYRLNEEEGHTVFTLTQDNCKTEEARDHSEKNWKQIMETIKKMVEEG